MELAYCEARSLSSTNLRNAKPASVSLDPRRIGLLGTAVTAVIIRTFKNLHRTVSSRVGPYSPSFGGDCHSKEDVA